MSGGNACKADKFWKSKTSWHDGRHRESSDRFARACHAILRGAAILGLALAATTTDVKAQAQEAPPECMQFERLTAPLGLAPTTGACSTFDPMIGGWRNALAQHGIGIILGTSASVNYDFRSRGDSPQIYGGQKPTYLTGASLILTYDLSRFGLPDGSIFTINPQLIYSNFEGTAIPATVIQELYFRVPLYNKQVDLYAGFINLGGFFNTLGIGDIAGANVLGAGSSLTGQLGLSGYVPSPSFIANIATQDQRLYLQTGFGRSISPSGVVYDAEHNRTGLRFDAKDSGLVVINEVGYRIQPATDQKKLWLRFGAVYNDSDFSRIGRVGQTDANYGFYSIVDLQITQPDSSLPFRGWYLRANADYSSPTVNSLTSNLGLTLYNVGPFASRTQDLFAIAVTRISVSDELVRSLRVAGLRPARDLTTASVSYAFKIHDGVYWNNTLSYTSTPTVAPQRDAAVNIISNLTMNF